MAGQLRRRRAARRRRCSRSCPRRSNSCRRRDVFATLLAGILLFFVLEKLVLWRHCHTHDCEVHDGSVLPVLVGDAFHNFVDGAVIAAAVMTSVPLGISTAVAVAAHEIPQEVGDFAILLHAGYSRSQALLLNVLSALASAVGAIAAFVAFDSFRAAAALLPRRSRPRASSTSRWPTSSRAAPRPHRRQLDAPDRPHRRRRRARCSSSRAPSSTVPAATAAACPRQTTADLICRSTRWQGLACCSGRLATMPPCFT